MHWTVHLEGGPRRVNHAAAAVGDLIYTFGGYCSAELKTYRKKQPIDVHILNTVNLRWKQLPKPLPNSKQYFVTPYQRYGHTAVAYGQFIFVWGGRNDESACNTLYCFDTETYLWSCPQTSGTIPSSRDGHSTCIIGHNMYIFGGFEDDFELYCQDVHVLDLRTFTWSYVVTQGEPPDFRDFHTATAIGNRMYIFGGRSDRIGPHSSDNDFYPNRIMYLNTATMQWHKPKTFGESPIGRRSHSAFVYEGCLYIFGGYNGMFCQHYNDLHKFCPRTNTWTEVITLGCRPKKRRRQVCIVIENRMFLFGGTSPNPVPDASVLYFQSEDFDPQDVKLMDHDDLHILDLRPSLKTLSMLAVMNYKLTDASLPEDLKWELNVATANSWMSSVNLL